MEFYSAKGNPEETFLVVMDFMSRQTTDLPMNGRTDKMRKKTKAVIVFKNPDKLFQDRKARSFTSDTEEWKRLVRYFRNKQEISPPITHKMAQEFKRLHYVFGPISLDGKIQAMILTGNPLQGNRSGRINSSSCVLGMNSWLRIFLNVEII